MLSEGGDQSVPLRVVLGRRDDLFVPEGVIIQARGQRLGHEADLDKRPHAVGQQAIVDLIDIGPVVDRVALCVLAVDAILIVEDGVEADVAKAGDLLYLAQIVAVAFAQRKNGAAGAEHLLPVVWKGRGRCVNVDDDRHVRLARGPCCLLSAERRRCGRKKDSGDQS